MKHFLLVFALFTSIAAADVTAIEAPCDQLRQYATQPKTIPDTAEDVFSSTVFIEELVLTNPTASAVLVTVSDKQSTAKEIAKVEVPAYGIYHAKYACRYSPNGVTWVGASAAVVGYMRVRK